MMGIAALHPSYAMDYEEVFPLSEEWKIEIEKRCREIDEGRVELIPAEKVFAELKQKYS